MIDGKDNGWEVGSPSMLLCVVTVVRMIWMVVYDLAHEFMRQCLLVWIYDFYDITSTFTTYMYRIRIHTTEQTYTMK